MYLLPQLWAVDVPACIKTTQKSQPSPSVGIGPPQNSSHSPEGSSYESVQHCQLQDEEGEGYFKVCSDIFTFENMKCACGEGDLENM